MDLQGTRGVGLKGGQSLTGLVRQSVNEVGEDCRGSKIKG